MLSVRVYADEVILRLDQLPRRVRAAAHKGLENVIEELHQKLFQGLPGKYLDPGFVRSGVADIGSTVSGFIETEDKPGVYTILPTKARMLRFFAKSGDLVFARAVYRHPFLKASPEIARLLEESKPWIVDQLEDAIIEAL